MLDELGLDYDTRALAVDLGVAQQQMVEIAKALSQRARILVMDEPTAALSERESNALFALIRQLRASGVAIVYISHRMQEVFELGRPGDGAARRAPRGNLARGRDDARPADRHDGRTRGRRRVQAPSVRRGGQDRAGCARIDDRDRRARCRPQRARRRDRRLVRPDRRRAHRGRARDFRRRRHRRRRGPYLGRDRRGRTRADRRARRRADPGEPQARRPGAQALGPGQSAGRKPVEAFPARLVSRRRGVPACARADRPAARDSAGAAAAGARAFGRQSAEGRHRQVAGRRVPAFPVR